MPLLIKKRVMAAKVETTIGTAESLAGANASFNAYDIQIQPTITMNQRQAQGSFNSLSATPGQYMGKVTFKTDLGWDGTTTEPTWASTLMPGCGVVSSGSDPTVFTPRSEAPGSNVKTLTIGIYEDGVLKVLAGAMGNCKIHLPTGQQSFAEWEFTGVWVAPTDVALLSPTYPTAAALRFASASAVTLNSVNVALMREIVLDFGNVVTAREDARTASGLNSFLVTDRKPKITLDPESVLVATQDVHGMWIAGTESAFAVTMDAPGTATLALSVPKSQIINIQEGERNGVQIDQIELQANRNGNTADQEFSLTFTAAS